jgi:hypothetical protein
VVAARDAGRNVPLWLCGAQCEEGVATLEVAAADDDGSVYRFLRVHSSWSPRALLVTNDAITGGTAFEIGLHETAENGGGAADADLFGTAVSMASARTQPTDLLFEALNIDKIEKRIWELLGLASDPGKYFDLTMTGTTVGTGAGTISARLQFVEQV